MRAITILFSLALISCNQSSDINIINNNGTFSSGETFIIELYAPIYKEIMPSFYLFSDQDTLALPFDFEKQCAVYKATHNIEKKHCYKGYVVYATADNEKKKSNYEIRYKIRN